MDTTGLKGLLAFQAVARRGGFTAAAGELGISPSAVSQAVRALEARLGQPLLLRTTRSVALTEAGRALFERSAGPARQIDEALAAAAGGAEAVSGLLRLNVPRAAVPLAVAPLLPAMQARHPGVKVEIFVEDASVDIVALGFDAGIRVGSMLEQDMVAVRLTPPFRAGLYAAPAYIERRGAPASLAELAAHDCINYRQISADRLYRWELMDRDREVELAVDGPLIVNDLDLALHAILAGQGIGYLFDLATETHVAAGRLVPLLPETAIEEPGLFLYFPRGAETQPKLRAFIDLARELL